MRRRQAGYGDGTAARRRTYERASRLRLRRIVLAALFSPIVMMGGIALTAAPALAARGHAFEKSFGSEGAGNGQLSKDTHSGAETKFGVAVNEATGDVYVVDAGGGRVEWFSSEGAFEGQFNGSGTYEVKGKVETGAAAPEGAFRGPEEIAVDDSCKQHSPELTEVTIPSCKEFDPSNGDVYVVDSRDYVGARNFVIDKFTATGEYLSELTKTSVGASELEVLGVAIDQAGHLWIDYLPEFGGKEPTLAQFNDAVSNELVGAPFNLSIEKLGTLEPGLAVDRQGDLYAKGQFGEFSRDAVAKLTSSGEVLSRVVGNEIGYWPAVEFSSGDLYMGQEGKVSRYTSEGTLLEVLGEGHLQDAMGVAVNSATGNVYVADGQAFDVDVFSLEPPARPTLEGVETVSDVAAESATLEGQINPRGVSSEYRFEYGRCATSAASSCASSGYEGSVPSPAGKLGAGFEIEVAIEHVTGLAPRTTYHARLVAENEFGEASSEAVFQTQPVGGAFALPDGREWELVSPPNMHGSSMEPIFEGLIQAAANGDVFAGWASQPNEAQPAGNANGVEVISERGAAGWSSQDITTSHVYAPVPTVGNGTEFRFYSENMERLVVQPFGDFTPLSPQATEQTAYLHANYLHGEVANACSQSCFEPLVSNANVPSGTHFGENNEENACLYFICGPRFVGASPDAEHIVLESPDQLTDTPTEGQSGLYEWSAGQLQLVSILPNGEHNSAGGQVAIHPGLGQGQRGESARDAVSSDGALIVWQGLSTTNHDHLYLRDTATGETTQLDAPQGGTATGAGEPVYMTASTDDSHIFFIDEAGLTPEASSSGNDLYEYDVNAPPGSRLRDLTVDASSGEAAEVANVTGVSENGSYVYFSAGGVLAPGATAGECGGRGAPLGDSRLCNLYVLHDGTTTFIASLSQKDWPDWAGATSDLTNMVGRVSPNGRYLAFMSERSLTGYDNTDIVSGEPDEEVYLYDSAAEGGHPALVCASCNPTGARPIGEQAMPNGEIGPMSRNGMWNATNWLAAAIPSWTNYTESAALHQSRYLFNSGRLLFDSHDPLVPQDVGGSWNVYEYEPPGVGSCSTGLSTYSESAHGCQSLISSGTSSEPSLFLDASESGGDVFFLTEQKLLAEDDNSTPHVYDAHECTSAVPCFPAPAVSPPPCESGEGCKSAPNAEPAVFAALPSSTFSGPGNATPPRRVDTTKRKHSSEAQKRRRALKRCARRKTRKQRRRCQSEVRRRFHSGVKVAGRQLRVASRRRGGRSGTAFRGHGRTER